MPKLYSLPGFSYSQKLSAFSETAFLEGFPPLLWELECLFPTLLWDRGLMWRSPVALELCMALGAGVPGPAGWPESLPQEI